MENNMKAFTPEEWRDRLEDLELIAETLKKLPDETVKKALYVIQGMEMATESQKERKAV